MRLMIVLAGTVFVAESFIMFGLGFVQIDNRLVETVIDAFALTVF